MTTENTPDRPLPEETGEFGKLLLLEAAVKSYVAERRKALFARMRDEQQRTGGKAFSHNYATKAGVTFTVRDADDKIIVKDPDALLAWVEDNAPSEIETVFQVRPAFQESLLKRVKGTDTGVFDPETGGEVPGLKYVPAGDPTSFNTAWKGDGKEVAFQEVLSALAGTGAGALLGIEGGDQA